ncbi:MAG: cation transporter [Ruminococcus sp.]|nr:cation transporter [Ruminococcus sp.]
MSDVQAQMIDREKKIVRTSFIGIGANILLAVFKAIVGLAANSVAIVSDAVNNMTDALSSVITIIGTKLASKAPDKKHPMGHGRAEYMSALVVSAIVFYAGFTALVDSVKKIIHPEEPSYGISAIIILVSAIAVKLILGAYTKSTGKKVNSGSLIASGEDALNDAILSGSVLVSTIIYLVFKFDIEAFVGVLISVMIIKASIEMISEAVSEMLGKRADAELSRSIKQIIARAEGVHGVYDLVLNNYGPDRYLASAHMEIDQSMTAGEIDALTRGIEAAVYKETSVPLVALGIYAVNTKDDKISKLRSDLRTLVMSFDGALQMHGFFLNEKTNTIAFDVILDFAVDREAVFGQIVEAVCKKYPEYKFDLTLDTDFSD